MTSGTWFLRSFLVLGPSRESTYQYVLQRTGTYGYVSVRTGTYWYVSARIGTNRYASARSSAYWCVLLRIGLRTKNHLKNQVLEVILLAY